MSITSVKTQYTKKIILFCFLFVSSTNWLFASHNNSHSLGNGVFIDRAFLKAEDKKVVRLPAPRMSYLVGHHFNRYQLTAFREGKWQLIPFQIEEFDLEGNLYFSELAVGSDGKVGVFDANDQLIFMLADAGDAADSAQLLDQKAVFLGQAEEQANAEVIELSIRGHREDRFVYLWLVPNAKPVDPYVTYDLEGAQINTPFYELKSNPKNLI